MRNFMIHSTTILSQEFEVDAAELTTETIVYPVEIPGRIALIDADFIAYHVAHLFPDANDVFSIYNKADDIVNHYRMSVGAEKSITCTTTGDNKSYKFQQAIQKPYQWTRKTEKHPTVEIVKSHLEMTNKLFTGIGSIWEADDQIGVLAWTALCRNDDYVIISPDKDLRMISGKHYDFKTGLIHEHYGFGELSYSSSKLTGYGDVWFWAQMLMGDRVDGITGLPYYIKENSKLGKVGPKTAYEFLKDATNNDEAHHVVADLYLKGEYKDYRDNSDVDWNRVFISEASMLWMKRSYDPCDVVKWLGGAYEDEENRCYSRQKSNAEKAERSMSPVFTINS